MGILYIQSTAVLLLNMFNKSFIFDFSKALG